MTTTPIPEPGPERRIALVPVLVAIAALLVAAVLTAVIVALATQNSDTTAAPAVSPTAVEVAPAPAETEEAPAAPRPEPGRNECVDALGDGGALDLDAVAVAGVDDGLLVRFALAEALPPGEVLLGVTAIGRQDRTVLLAVRIIDGEVDEVFAVDLRATGNDDDERGRGNDDDPGVDRYDEDRAQVDGRQVLVEFPDEMLKDLGNDWSWSATASTGSDADRCPVEGQLAFER